MTQLDGKVLQDNTVEFTKLSLALRNLILGTVVIDGGTATTTGSSPDIDGGSATN